MRFAQTRKVAATRQTLVAPCWASHSETWVCTAFRRPSVLITLPLLRWFGLLASRTKAVCETTCIPTVRAAIARRSPRWQAGTAVRASRVRDTRTAFCGHTRRVYRFLVPGTGRTTPYGAQAARAPE